MVPALLHGGACGAGARAAHSAALWLLRWGAEEGAGDGGGGWSGVPHTWDARRLQAREWRTAAAVAQQVEPLILWLTDCVVCVVCVCGVCVVWVWCGCGVGVVWCVRACVRACVHACVHVWLIGVMGWLYCIECMFWDKFHVVSSKWGLLLPFKLLKFTVNTSSWPSCLNSPVVYWRLTLTYEFTNWWLLSARRVPNVPWPLQEQTTEKLHNVPGGWTRHCFRSLPVTQSGPEVLFGLRPFNTSHS